MKTFADIDIVKSIRSGERGRKFRKSWKRFEIRSAVARSDEMLDLPQDQYSRIVREIDRAVDLCESPIEQVALYQMAGRGYGHDFLLPLYASVSTVVPSSVWEEDFVIVPQVCVGPYRVDFLVMFPGGRRIAVECDGKKFHNAERDGERDVILMEDYGLKAVVRARGGEIWRGNAWTERLAAEIRRVA